MADPYLIRRAHASWSPATCRNVNCVHHCTRTEDVTLTLTDYQAKYIAHELTRRFPPDSMNWKGGGGFRYYRLAPSLLEKDKWGNWVINKSYNAAMLAGALCKLEGFTYAPSDSVYWQHGHSTERDFIYITTAHLSHEQLQQLSDEVGPDRSLLVLCTAFRARADRHPNLTVKKIPKAVLARCEWGHDDYSLRVENLPQAPSPPGQLTMFGDEES